MATYTIYSNSADGYIYSTGSAYSANRTGFGLSAVTNDVIYVGQYSFDDGCLEGFISFDTSVVAGSIASATLSVFGVNDESSQDFTINAALRDWGPSLTTADWVAGASLSALTTLATFATSGFVEGNYNQFTSTALAANINTSGATRMLLYSSRHSGNNNPSADEAVTFRSGEDGEELAPRLVVVTGGGKPARRRPSRFFQRSF